MPSSIDNLEPRRLYLRSLAEIVGLEQTDFRWLTINVWKLTPSGGISNDAKPVTSFSEFIMQSINLMDRERLQIVPGVRDNAKIYFYDREIRQFSMQGFVYDVPFDSSQVAEGLRPFAFSSLRKLYNEELRTSAATRNNHIVELDYGQFRIYCTLSNMSSMLASDTPSIYVVSFVILVEAVRIKANVMPAMAGQGRNAINWRGIEQRLLGYDSDNEARGILSREAAIKIGLGQAVITGGLARINERPKLAVGVERALRKGVSKSGVPGKPVIVPQRRRIRV